MKPLSKYGFFLRLFCLSIIVLPGMQCAGSRPVPLKEPDAYFQEGMRALERKRYTEAAEKFQQLLNNFPGSRLAPDAQYYLAEAYFSNRDHVNAIFEYQRLLDTYPSSQWLGEAQFKIAESHYHQARRAELDQQETREALNYFRYFIADNPDSPLVELAQERIIDCRNRLAKKQYLNGRLYQRQGHLEAAVITYADVLRNYPDTSWYYHTLLNMGKIAAQQGELQEARQYWAEVVRQSEDEKLREEAREELLRVGGE